MHSYANGDKPVFPMWAGVAILIMIGIMIIAGIKERKYKKLHED